MAGRAADRGPAPPGASGGILDRLCECVGTHVDVRHATFQIEPQSHRAHEDLGDLHA